MRYSIMVMCGDEMFSTRSPERVFEFLDDRIGTEEAIEASSWCELATVGEEYETERVYILFAA